LISTTLNSTTSLFNYNGDGVRLKQTLNGVVTTYTQELAASLPVVLQAKTGVTSTHYLYALETRPFAQITSNGAEYLLPDGLGSVRQIASVSGHIIFTQDYAPYGDVLNSSGSGQSAYGFTGEEQDQSGLIFLRARYMQPKLGIFLSRDPWAGDPLRPGSMNGFNYVEANPINHVDPSGFDWQHPTMGEGNAIHAMICLNFLVWGMGRNVRCEVQIQGAAKGRTGNWGRADLVDFDNRGVYEVKHRPHAQLAQQEALWYRAHLNADPRHRPWNWTLGTLYIQGTNPIGVTIGPWPNDPDHIVKAALYAAGAVVYWGEPTPGHTNPQRVPIPNELWETLAKLAQLSQFCKDLIDLNEKIRERRIRRIPGPSAVEITSFEAH
jgi:RHS repeat-associated protein